MPVAGKTPWQWAKYLICGAAFMAMGSQIVHIYYKPLRDFPDDVNEAREQLLSEYREKKNQRMKLLVEREEAEEKRKQELELKKNNS